MHAHQRGAFPSAFRTTGDYFDFVAGSQREGSLTENDKAIRAWMEKSAAKR